ncbi:MULTISPECIES: oxidoreductase [unclassified Dietzia]|uniref:oxidoreductase n=1 Tax=unclassified Dietzia TaxID=2617939 RepID=UPI0015FB0D71|nr:MULTISPECIES: oxidoreductase [unclassified Dietzia]MBB1023516.1 oxidoreductase [Dietzia sp. DQ12-76]MBB1026134.1 oxidoreductase [Dietzia sp. DQ11-38-2]
MRSLSLLVVLVMVTAGCARFDDRLEAPFTPAPGPGMDAGPPSTPPGIPPPTSSPRPDEQDTPPATGPCVDPDPAVIATCLEPAVAVAGLGERALVAESTGAVKIVSVDGPPEDFGRVDPRGGRVAAVAPSPDFTQDRLLYLLVVGDGPSRVERLARGDAPRTVAELAPAETGGLAFVDAVLTVGVGSDVVRFPGFRGIGTAQNPEVVARDVGRITGLCTHGSELYLAAVTDRGAVIRSADRVIWTWPDQRSAGGCAAAQDSLALALPDGERADTLALTGGAARGQPEPLAEGRYGRITGLAAVGDGVLLGGTTNKSGGSPVPTDDRAVILPQAAGGGGDART